MQIWILLGGIAPSRESCGSCRVGPYEGFAALVVQREYDGRSPLEDDRESIGNRKVSHRGREPVLDGKDVVWCHRISLTGWRFPHELFISDPVLSFPPL